jgi:sugar-phosphatase
VTARASALLLDLDGTLVDSEAIHRSGFERWFAARDWPFDAGVAALFTGRRADDVFRTVDGPWSGEDPAELFDDVVSHMPRDRRPDLVPGAEAVLTHAREHGIPLALVTSANTRWAELALEPVGGLRHFDAVVTRDDVNQGKPDPACYALACARLGADPAAAVACEDAPNGVRAATAAGVGTVVGVLTTFAPDELRAAGATTTMPDLLGLAHLLGAR